MKLAIITELHKFLPDQKQQYEFGDCNVQTYLMVKRAINKGVSDFIVVDGMVEIDGSEFPHSWIERGGRIIDPTVNQFRGKEIEYNPPESFRDEFSPKEYVENFEDQYGEI